MIGRGIDHGHGFDSKGARVKKIALLILFALLLTNCSKLAVKQVDLVKNVCVYLAFGREREQNFACTQIEYELDLTNNINQVYLCPSVSLTQESTLLIDDEQNTIVNIETAFRSEKAIAVFVDTQKKLMLCLGNINPKIILINDKAHDEKSFPLSLEKGTYRIFLKADETADYRSWLDEHINIANKRKRENPLFFSSLLLHEQGREIRADDAKEIRSLTMKDIPVRRAMGKFSYLDEQLNLNRSFFLYNAMPNEAFVYNYSFQQTFCHLPKETKIVYPQFSNEKLALPFGQKKQSKLSTHHSLIWYPVIDKHDEKNFSMMQSIITVVSDRVKERTANHANLLFIESCDIIFTFPRPFIIQSHDTPTRQVTREENN